MRLMGIGRLYALATSGSGAVASAAASLHAELAAFEWSCADEAAADYPNARFAGHRIEIGLPQDNCVVVAVNYRAGVTLIEFAGPRADRDNPLNRKRSKLT